MLLTDILPSIPLIIDYFLACMFQVVLLYQKQSIILLFVATITALLLIVLHLNRKHAMDLKSNNIKTITKVPFYEPPPRKTSAEIINEARLAIKGKYVYCNSKTL